MAAFAPLLFVSGTFGQILGQVPIVVITVLAMSLIEVFCILPAHLSHPEGWSQWPLNKIQSIVAGRVQLFRDNHFTSLHEAKAAVRSLYQRLKATLKTFRFN